MNIAGFTVNVENIFAFTVITLNTFARMNTFLTVSTTLYFADVQKWRAFEYTHHVTSPQLADQTGLEVGLTNISQSVIRAVTQGVAERLNENLHD